MLLLPELVADDVPNDLLELGLLDGVELFQRRELVECGVDAVVLGVGAEVEVAAVVI